MENNTQSTPDPLPAPAPSVMTPIADSREWRHREFSSAFGNAAKLGASLTLTWTIALVARLYIPRYLGPERFGVLNFADAFSATAFVFAGLGLDTYVRKEISVRPGHANDFVGGVIALRWLLLAAIYVCMETVLRFTHTSSEVRLLVYIYGMVQFFTIGGSTSAGLLQATGRVNEMSVLSVIAKLAWAVCIIVAVTSHLGLWAFAATLALTEGVKALVLFLLAKKHLNFRMQVQVHATKVVLVASLPFFISSLATSINDRLGSNLLGFLTTHSEVGWYGAAAGLAGMTMLLAPLVAWVLTPMFARAAARSKDELYKVVCRSLELILVLVIPVCLMMLLGADLWVSVLFGKAFAPAALALRVLAVSTILMYVSLVAYFALAVLDYTWRMSLISLLGIIVNLAGNLMLIRSMSRYLGPGGAGAASALSTLITEIVVVVLLLRALGSRALDHRLRRAALKSALAAAILVGLDTTIFAPFGIWRLGLELLLYFAFVMLSGALDLQSMFTLVRTTLNNRHAAANNAPPS